jgi:hypothetical protein
MLAILHLLVMFVADIFKSRRRLEAENLFLRHQLNIALRQAPPRLQLCGGDRALLVWMTRLWPMSDKKQWRLLRHAAMTADGVVGRTECRGITFVPSPSRGSPARWLYLFVGCRLVP